MIQQKIKKTIYIAKPYLAFGDSFIKMFMHCDNVRYYKYKGKTIRGLSKPDDPDRKKIEGIIARENSPCIFLFGQVDYGLVRYYKRAQHSEYEVNSLKLYVDWLASLEKEVIVICIFPSPVKRENIVRSLKKYGSIEADFQEEALILEEYDRSEKILAEWNALLEKECKAHQIKCLNVFPTHQIDEEFLDLSDVNLHLRYVPVLKKIGKTINLKIDWMKVDAEETRYEKEKAERMKAFLERDKTEVTLAQKQVRQRWSLTNGK